MTLDPQQVECVARAALTAALTADGLEVARPERDAGIDLLAYTINPLRVVPIQVKTVNGAVSSIDRKHRQIDGLVMIYIRNPSSPADAEFYAMTCPEASAVTDGGGWSWDIRGRQAQTRVTGEMLVAVLNHRVLPGEWEETLLGTSPEPPWHDTVSPPSAETTQPQPKNPPLSLDLGGR